MDYPLQTVAQLSIHLRAFRKAKGWTQKQLGEVLGVGQARVARMEADPASISTGQLIKVLHLLGARIILSDTPLGGWRVESPRADAW